MIRGKRPLFSTYFEINPGETVALVGRRARERQQS
jgi:hypothetical protein